MEETKRHGDAFDFYYSQGNERSYLAVARRVHVGERTIQRWARSFNWQTRIVQRDVEVNKRTEQKTNTAIVNTKADYRAEIKEDREGLVVIRQRYEKLIADATEAIEKGEIKIHDANELDRIAGSLKKFHDLNKDYIKLDLELVGERGEISGDITLITTIKRPDGWKDGNKSE